MYKVRIGCSNVYETEDLSKAIDEFEDYVNESKGRDPLYNGKSVLLIDDDKALLKYRPGKKYDKD